MPFETKLREELDRELDRLKTYEVGSEEHKAIADTTTRLMDRAIELKKIDAEAKNQAKAQENEKALRMAQMRDERNDNIARNVITFVQVAGSYVLFAGLAVMAFTYEEKGTIASPIGKKLLGMVVPKL